MIVAESLHGDGVAVAEFLPRGSVGDRVLLHPNACARLYKRVIPSARFVG